MLPLWVLEANWGKCTTFTCIYSKLLDDAITLLKLFLFLWKQVLTRLPDYSRVIERRVAKSEKTLLIAISLVVLVQFPKIDVFFKRFEAIFSLNFSQIWCRVLALSDFNSLFGQISSGLPKNTVIFYWFVYVTCWHHLSDIHTGVYGVCVCVCRGRMWHILAGKQLR